MSIEILKNLPKEDRDLAYRVLSERLGIPEEQFHFHEDSIAMEYAKKFPGHRIYEYEMAAYFEVAYGIKCESVSFPSARAYENANARISANDKKKEWIKIKGGKCQECDHPNEFALDLCLTYSWEPIDFKKIDFKKNTKVSKDQIVVLCKNCQAEKLPYKHYPNVPCKKIK